MGGEWRGSNGSVNIETKTYHGRYYGELTHNGRTYQISRPTVDTFDVSDNLCGGSAMFTANTMTWANGSCMTRVETKEKDVVEVAPSSSESDLEDRTSAA